MKACPLMSLPVPDCLLDEEARREKEISRNIDKDIKKAKLEHDFKLLLLGTGEAGKSTFVKHMKILYGEGFEEQEINNFKIDVINNVVDAAKILIKGMDDLHIPYENEATFLSLVPQILNHSNDDQPDVLDPHIAGCIGDLWSDSGVKDCFSRRGVELQIPDSTGHFLDSLDRIVHPEYVPTDEDILLSRKQTTGIIEYEFNFDDLKFRLVDVGGQRGERKKWMHCFNEVTAIIFLVAVSEYDQVLAEDGVTNRLCEAVRLFKNIITNPWLKDTNVILFLNKMDLFEEKLQRVDLVDFFPKFTGPKKDKEAAIRFIKKLFEEVNDDQLREIHSFDTVAIDPDNTRKVFIAVKVIIFKEIRDVVGI